MYKVTCSAVVALLLCSCSTAPSHPNRGVVDAQNGATDCVPQAASRATEPKSDPGTYLLNACYYSYMGDWDRAIQDYSRAIELNPESALAYGCRGLTYVQKGDSDRAIQDLTRAVKLEPKLAEAYGWRGTIYATKGDWDHAIRDYSRVIKLKPADAEAHYNRGDARYRKGDRDRAIADYTRAIELRPDLHSGYLGRARAYAGNGDAGRALADYARAVEMAPNRSECSNGLAWFLATCPQDRGRDGRKAVAYARKACELTQWQNAACLDTLAAACAEDGQFAEAVKWQQQALEDPEYLRDQGEQASARLKLYQQGKPHREAVQGQSGSPPSVLPAN